MPNKATSVVEVQVDNEATAFRKLEHRFNKIGGTLWLISTCSPHNAAEIQWAGLLEIEYE